MCTDNVRHKPHKETSHMPDAAKDADRINRSSRFIKLDS